MATSDDKRYLSVAETARELRVSRQSVYRAVESGDLPAVQLRPAGALRVPADALEARAREQEGTRA